MTDIHPSLSAEQTLSAAKRALLERWRHGAAQASSQPTIQASTMREDHYPLSSGQQRLWFLEQLDPRNPTYVIRCAFHLRGPLLLPPFLLSLRSLLARHSSLRSSFFSLHGLPRLRLSPSLPLPLSFLDLSRLPHHLHASLLPPLLSHFARLPFSLSSPPLLRFSLLRLHPHHHLFCFCIHHLLADGWSLDLFFRELAASYRAASLALPSPLPPLPIQYVDYTRWQQHWLAGPLARQQRAYWRQHLAGVPPLLPLPTDHLRPPLQRFEGASYPFVLPAPLLRSLRSLSQQEGCTLFMTLLAALHCLLFRYTGQSDSVVGTDSANRTSLELEGLIGFFVNQLVLRTDLSGNPTFRELLARERRVVLGAQAHQEFPFGHIVDDIQSQRQPGYNPLFQVLFSLEQPRPTPGMGELQVQPIDLDNGAAQFDLAWVLSDCTETICGSIEYRTDLFERATIARFAEHFTWLLAQASADPDQRIGSLSSLPPAQHQQRLRWNATEQRFPQDSSFYPLFQAQVRRTPHAPAIVWGAQCLTYAQVHRQVCTLAGQLVTDGIGPECLVAILAERQPSFLIALLAVWLAGGAYLPLDPHYPDARLAQILHQSQAAYLLVGATQQARPAGLLARLHEHRLRVACIETVLAQPAAGETLKQTSAAHAHNLAYVIFTSGSTGTPKGAMIEHRGMINHLYAKITALQLQAGDRVAQTASMCFDISVWQSLAALLVGGQVVIIPDEISHDPTLLCEEIAQQQVTVLETVPSLLRLLAEDSQESEERRLALRSLRWLLSTGEALPAALLRQWQTAYPSIPLVNAYGPTECSDDVTHYTARQAEQGTEPYVAIGTPVANTQIFILDSAWRPQPINVVGELYVGGVGVGRGYLYQADKTAAAFLPDPFAQHPGARLYRTGDLARYRHDGSIEYLARSDYQVKIRGFRIETGEIEAVLTQHPQVHESAVVAYGLPTDEKRLAAYLVCTPGSHPDEREIRRFLADRLPAYMLPAAFTFLAHMPLTPHGKYDRQALPPPVHSEQESSPAYVAPRTAAEETLAAIWAQVLGRSRISVHDNFFALGGDSILSLQIISRARAAGLQLTPKHIFQHQTIAELALLATPLVASAGSDDDLQGSVPLLPIQSWFFAQRFPHQEHWNQDILLVIKQRLDAGALIASLHELVRHHAALRLRFTLTEHGWSQWYAPERAPGLFSLQTVDLSALASAQLPAQIARAAREAHLQLNLARGPLFQVVWIDCGPERPARLHLVLHHLVVDGVSWRILLEDLHTLYQQACARQPSTLPARTTSFKGWAQRLWSYAATADMAGERAFWLQLPWQAIQLLPRDLPGANSEARTETYSLALERQETQELVQNVPALYHTQITEVLLTALGRAILPWSGSQYLLVDLERHGRADLFDEEIDLTHTVGWFTSLFPVILPNLSRLPIDEALKRVKEQMRHIPHNGAGYGVLREICKDPELCALPAAELSFTYLGQYDQELSELELFALAPEDSGAPRHPLARRPYLFDVITRIASGRFQVLWEYNADIHRRETVAALAQAFLTALRAIVRHCQHPDAGGFTPSDFPAARLNQKNLATVLRTIQQQGGRA